MVLSPQQRPIGVRIEHDRIAVYQHSGQWRHARGDNGGRRVRGNESQADSEPVAEMEIDGIAEIGLRWEIGVEVNSDSRIGAKVTPCESSRLAAAIKSTAGKQARRRLR